MFGAWDFVSRQLGDLEPGQPWVGFRPWAALSDGLGAQATLGSEFGARRALGGGFVVQVTPGDGSWLHCPFDPAEDGGEPTAEHAWRV